MSAASVFTRRVFLKGSVAAAIATQIPTAISWATAAPLPPDKWVYDPASGVFKNAGASARVLRKAERMAKTRVKVLELSSGPPILDEYGRAWQYSAPNARIEEMFAIAEPKITKALAQLLPKVHGWFQVPEIRASVPHLVPVGVSSIGGMIGFYGIGVRA